MSATEVATTPATNGAQEEKKHNRHQLAKVVDLYIAPPRIRRYYDRNGINLDVETRLNEKKETITKLKKAGGPPLPKAPEHPGKDANDAAKAAYKEARQEYETAKQKYDVFVSDRYLHVETVYNVCRALHKLHDLLTKKGEKTDNRERELADVVAMLHDKPHAKTTKETDEVYKERVAKFQKLGYAKLVENVDLKNADAVQARLNKLMASESELTAFFERDAIAKERIRFNDPAAVALATTMEVALEELVEFGIKNTRDLHKKIVQPDHVICDGVKKLNFWKLYKGLRPVKSIRDRQRRKREWEEAYAKAKREAYQTARSKAKKTKRKAEKLEFKYPTFPETEVESGFATVEMHKDDKGVEKPYYYWYGIDVDHPNSPAVDDDTAGFHHYIGQVCKKVMEHHVDIGDNEAQEIRFSNHLRKLLSDLIIAYISRVSPMVRILIKAVGVKTVNHEVIKDVLLLQLADDYQCPTGEIVLKEEHKMLFDRINEKVALCQKHQTGAVTKESADDADDEPAAPAGPAVPTKTDGHADDPVPSSKGKDEDDDDEDDDEDDPKTPASAAAKGSSKPSAPTANGTASGKTVSPASAPTPAKTAPKGSAPAKPASKAAPKGDRAQVRDA